MKLPQHDDGKCKYPDEYFGFRAYYQNSRVFFLPYKIAVLYRKQHSVLYSVMSKQISNFTYHKIKCVLYFDREKSAFDISVNEPEQQLTNIFCLLLHMLKKLTNGPLNFSGTLFCPIESRSLSFRHSGTTFPPFQPQIDGGRNLQFE